MRQRSSSRQPRLLRKVASVCAAALYSFSGALGANKLAWTTICAVGHLRTHFAGSSSLAAPHPLSAKPCCTTLLAQSAAKKVAPDVITSAEHEEDRDKYLAWLIAREIRRDGGTTLATWLTQAYGQAISRLLHQARCPQLLEFLRRRPYVFALSQRGGKDFVQLVSEWQQHALEVIEVPNKASVEVLELPDNSSAVLRAAARLQERSTWALRQRVSKWKRRNGVATAASGDADATPQREPRAGDAALTLKPAPVQWLLRKVQRELHGLLRLLPRSRPSGHLPFSEGWREVALPFLASFLRERPAAFVVVAGAPEPGGGDDDDDDDDDDGASSPTGPCVSLAEGEEEHGGLSSGGGGRGSLFTRAELEELRGGLRSVFRAAGLARKGSLGLHLGRVCGRPAVQRLLQGKSLREALALEPLASEFVCYKKGTHGGGSWYVRVSSHAGTDKEQPLRGPGELLTDEEGLFSLTGPRDAKAIAAGLAAAFAGATGQQPTAKGSLCVDMTAGVGGITLALAKTFRAVRAYEVNASRWEYLRENLRNAGVADDVDCLCCDSLEALVSETGAQASGVLPAAILDPPWGGTNYKRIMARGELRFAGLTLSEVVLRLAGKVSVLAIKLPLMFIVRKFIDSLPQGVLAGHSIRTIGRTQILHLRLVHHEASPDLQP